MWAINLFVISINAWGTENFWRSHLTVAMPIKNIGTYFLYQLEMRKHNVMDAFSTYFDQFVWFVVLRLFINFYKEQLALSLKKKKNWFFKSVFVFCVHFLLDLTIRNFIISRAIIQQDSN